MTLCMTQPDFLEKNFFAQNWEKGPKMVQKQGFFNLLENLVIDFYWIWSIMGIYTICCVPTQIPYLGKFCSWDIGQNVLSQIAGFFNQPYLQNKSMKQPDFVHVDTNLHKSWWENFWMSMARNGCGQSGHRTLKLAKSYFNDFWVGQVKN